MRAGIAGSLIPSGYLVDHFRSDFAPESPAACRAAPLTALARWWRRTARTLGPVSGARNVLDVAVLPLLQLLGYEVLHLEPAKDGFTGVVGKRGVPLATLVVSAWLEAKRGDATVHAQVGTHGGDEVGAYICRAAVPCRRRLSAVVATCTDV